MSNLKVFAITTQGENHIKTGKECQDYSLAINITDKIVKSYSGKAQQVDPQKQQIFKKKELVCCMAIVADGHGGDEFIRSAKGSEFAVDSAIKCIADFLRLKKEKPTEKEAKRLIQSIVKTWNDKIQSDIDMRPFGNSELENLSNSTREKYQSGEDLRHAYGTTLLAAISCEKYWFGFHIGDGRCVILTQDAQFEQPIPWDDRCFLNVTTSICDDDASERARVYISEHLPVGIFLCSDGIDDSYPVNYNEKYLAKFYRSLVLNFLDKDFDDAYKDIKEMLPALSKKGSGDDMSIAGIIDIDNLKKIAPKLQEQITVEKEKIARDEALAQRENNDREMIDKKSKEIEEYGYFIPKNSQTGTNIDLKA